MCSYVYPYVGVFVGLYFIFVSSVLALWRRSAFYNGVKIAHDLCRPVVAVVCNRVLVLRRRACADAAPQPDVWLFSVHICDEVCSFAQCLLVCKY